MLPDDNSRNFWHICSSARLHDETLSRASEVHGSRYALRRHLIVLAGSVDGSDSGVKLSEENKHLHT